MSENKHCSKCCVEKPYTDFVLSRGTRLSICKVCHNKQIKRKSNMKKDGTYINPKSLESRRLKFSEDMTLLHTGVYTYEIANYIDDLTKVEIYCTKHNGYFWQTPDSHRTGNGCKECAKLEQPSRNERATLRQSEVISKALAAHNDTYTYGNLVYTGATSHVFVTCREHGDFPILPNNLYNGGGCPKCSAGGYSISKPGNIYLLSAGNITKIGITNRDVSARLREVRESSGKDFIEVFSQSFEDGCVARSIEYGVKHYLKALHLPMTDKFDGYTESFFDVDIIMLIKNIKTMAQLIQGTYDSN